MKGKTCCVTGYRDLPQNEIQQNEKQPWHMRSMLLLQMGSPDFMSGFCRWRRPVILRSWCWKESRPAPALELIAVIPYRKRLDSLNK